MPRTKFTLRGLGAFNKRRGNVIEDDDDEEDDQIISKSPTKRIEAQETNAFEVNGADMT